MYFKHIYEKGLAQASYLIGCQETGEAVVIDPRRDIDVYLETAEAENLRITHITETHIHADFLSGSRELQAATGAKVLLSDEGGKDWLYLYEHIGLKDGAIFKVGNLKFEVMHTPGHTPEHISFILTDTKSSTKPIMIFTGDFVFVGDVGRPDLLEKAAGITGTQETGARDMFNSLKKFKQLPDYLQVWPGHGAGSACGKALGAVPSSTVGYEKLVNWALNIDDEEKFVNTLLDGQPEPPKYFSMMKKLNKESTKVLGGLPHPAKLTVSHFNNALNDGVLLVDTRDKLSFAGGHVPGAINIQDNSSFSTWAGWLLSYDAPFMLLAPNNRIEDLTKKLIRIGLDNIYGYLPGLESWTNLGHELETVEQITVEELTNNLGSEKIQIVDVRGIEEYKSGHIPGAMNLHVGYLSERFTELPENKKLIVHCASGDRSSTAASLLKSKGLKNVQNLTGGISCWQQKGNKVIKSGAEPVAV